jgi:serine/threonine-protein kinase
MNGVVSENDRSVMYEFGAFRVDVRKRQIERDGLALAITSKAFETLTILLSRSGETVSKSELMDAVWPDTAVEENNLTQQISALRKILGERAGDHKFIVTVPGRGYCFVADVRKVEVAAERAVDTLLSLDRPLEKKRSTSFVNRNAMFGHAIAIAYILVVCVPAFVTIWQAKSRGLKPQSIAILRFRSTGVGDELLGMGIRDTLRAKLGSLDDVTVRPADNSDSDDIVDTGKALDVDVVVTGSIQHDEDKVRVAVEMVDVSNERIVWGSTFDNDSSRSFELQDSITNAVLSALKRPKLSSRIDRSPISPNAQRLDTSMLMNRHRLIMRCDDHRVTLS